MTEPIDERARQSGREVRTSAPLAQNWRLCAVDIVSCDAHGMSTRGFRLATAEDLVELAGLVGQPVE